MPIITLTTDYGTRDHYAAVLKGVILGIAPTARLVDITHDVEPHNVLHGAFVLRQAWAWFPPGTIHLAIVDPGVGSDRRIILAKYASRYVIAPDNGLVTFVHRDHPAEAIYVVENARFFLPHPSNTFHGRDIMAPVAAHLADGVKPNEFGSPTGHIELLSVQPRSERIHNVFRGSVLYVDRFGTLVTNIRKEDLKDPQGLDHAQTVFVNGENLGPVRAAFCDVSPGEALGYVGSANLLEIAVNQGSAADRFSPLADIVIEVR